jgi:hypothetical protein
MAEVGKRFWGPLFSGLTATLSYPNRNVLATGLHSEGELGWGLGRGKEIIYSGCALMLRLQNILSITI